MNQDASSKSIVCCSDVTTLVGKSNPFPEIVAIEYYDGPVSGVIRCPNCSTVLRYKLLGWDGHQEKRVFSLATMPGEAWPMILALYSYDLPRFPVWAPRWDDPSTEEINRRQNMLRQILERRAEWSWIILASRNLDRLIDAKSSTGLLAQIEEQEVYGKAKVPWMKLFGLAET